jgi:hypothetical protein
LCSSPLFSFSTSSHFLMCGPDVLQRWLWNHVECVGLKLCISVVTWVWRGLRGVGESRYAKYSSDGSNDGVKHDYAWFLVWLGLFCCLRVSDFSALGRNR